VRGTDSYPSGPYSTSGSRTDSRFLQYRVSQFGLVAAGMFGFLLLLRVTTDVVRGNFDVFVSPPPYFLLLTVLVFTGVWAFTRGELRSFRYVRNVEGGGLILGSAALIGMGAYIPHEFNPEEVMTLALTQGFFARAIFVPSTAKRTLLLGVAIGTALILSVYTRDLGTDWHGPAGSALTAALGTAIWWTATTAICAAASRVIYGLRKRIDDAEQLGQYTLEEKLGEGAMGVVYRARHSMLARPTAVKLLMPEKFGEANLARFEREVQLTAQLTHPHTVTIFDYGRTPDGVFYYAMELLEGASLDRIIEVGGPQEPSRVAYIMDQVAAALSEAHGHGLIHRDIKPANIILTQQGGEPDVAKVVDFGLVKSIRDGDDPNLSNTGAIAGTPYYMAPETILAYQEIDARADLYALGAVCYFMLTGEPVFKGKNAGEICTHHVHTEPVSPSKRRDRPVPADLESIVLACLAKDPGDRPATAGHIRARLWAGNTLGKWNTDRARRWWREYGEEAKRRTSASDDAAGHTIAIDLKRHKRG